MGLPCVLHCLSSSALLSIEKRRDSFTALFTLPRLGLTSLSTGKKGDRFTTLLTIEYMRESLAGAYGKSDRLPGRLVPSGWPLAEHRMS